MARSRLHRRYVKAKHNPPLVTDLAEFVLPGFGGFAAARFVTRCAATQVAKRAPSWGRHAGAVAAVGTFGAAWFLAHKWKWLERWHTPIVVGSAIAALQSLIQLYLPMIGWMVSDATPEIAAGSAAVPSVQDRQLAQMRLQPTDEDPNEFVYNDAYDPGRYAGQNGPASMKIGALPPVAGKGVQAPQQPDGGAGQGVDPTDLMLDDAIGTANLGVFQTN